MKLPRAVFLAIGVSALALVGCTGPTSGSRSTWSAVVAGQLQPAPSLKMGDPAAIARILDEGVHRNQVMDHLQYLSETVGPRLTGSSQAEMANRWAADRLGEWGLTNVHLHKWGDIPVRFDRGVSSARVLTQAKRDGELDKVARELEFTTLAWSGGTKGPVRGRVVRAPQDVGQLESMKTALKGAWVLLPPPPQARQGLRSVGSEMNERALVRYAIQTGRSLSDLGVKSEDLANLESLIPMEKGLIEAGVLGCISSSRDERVWTTAFRRWRELVAGEEPRDVEVSVRLSDYDYMNSRLADGDVFELEVNLDHRFTPGPIPVYNTVAEIRGTEKPDEYVIVSAHLDTWNGPGSMGTTDNGTGASVTLEAARILKAAGARPKRTIKFILWTGEEQGLLGSKVWVAENQALWPRISAVFVDDGGTNSQGGLKCTEEMVPMLAAATAPVNNLFFDSVTGKPLNVNIQSQGDKFPRFGGSDHFSFVEKGMPGFFWDEVGRAEYGYGWHTQNDRMTLAVPEYLRQSATCSAVTAYNLACAPELLPRPGTETAGVEENRGRDRAR